MQLDEIIMARALGRPDPLPELLSEVEGFVQRFVVLSDPQLVAIALWVAHTHAFAAAEATPYLHVTSAERSSGKSRLLEVLALVVARALVASNVSEAALFRAIAARNPTVLLDEVDAVFGPRAREREDLRAILNAGYRRGAPVLRMGGPRRDVLEEFDAFAPKALAGLGELPDTLASRSIRVRLRPPRPNETFERFRARRVAKEAEGLRVRLATWAADDVISELEDADPSIPAPLSDRQSDCWEPLIAIADLAGEGWPERARAAAVLLAGEAADAESSEGLRLLADIHTLFGDRARVATGELVAGLNAMEEASWSEAHYGKGLDPARLAARLRPFEIRPATIRLGQKTCKGYNRHDFIDAWDRYGSSSGVAAVTSSHPRSDVEEQASPIPSHWEAASQIEHVATGVVTGVEVVTARGDDALASLMYEIFAAEEVIEP